MKEKIEEKLLANIERILVKEELTPSDVAILEGKLFKIEQEENKEESEFKKKEMFDLLMKTM